MWIAVNHPECLRTYRKENIDTRKPNRHKAKIIYKLLREIVEIDWPKPLYAVTSLGSLRFTTAIKYTEDDRHGAIHTTMKDTSENKICIWYVPPGEGESTASKTEYLENAIHAFINLSIHLFNDAEPKNPFYPSNPAIDANKAISKFKKGDKVKVNAGCRNKIYRTGIVSGIYWYDKFGCWLYVIERRVLLNKEKRKIFGKKYHVIRSECFAEEMKKL